MPSAFTSASSAFFAFWHAPVLFAQAQANAGAGAAGAAGQASSTGDLVNAFLPMLLLFVIGYFLLISPQLKERKRQLTMIKNLKKNDRVLTQSGIYGVVVSLDQKQNKIVLKVDDDSKTRIAFTLSSVTQVLSPEGSGSSQSQGDIA